MGLVGAILPKVIGEIERLPKTLPQLITTQSPLLLGKDGGNLFHNN